MDKYEKKLYDEEAKRSEIVDQETKTSEEGTKSTHTQYKTGRIDCIVQVPTCRVRQKINGVIKDEVWPRVGNVYAPVLKSKARINKEK